MSKIKSKVWGFQKKEVEEHIRNLKKVQEAELEELSKEIEKSQRENEILREELNMLTEKIDSLPAEIILERALKRVERVSKFIDQDVDIEVLAIDKITHQKTLALEKTMAEIDISLEKEKDIIEADLKNIVDNIVKGQERTKNINIDVIKSIGKVLPIADWLKSNKEEQTSSGKVYRGEELTDSTQEKNKMTADGTILESMIKPDTTDATLTDQNTKRHPSSELQLSESVTKLDPSEDKDTRDTKNTEDTKQNTDRENNDTSPNSILESVQEMNENGDNFFSISKSDFWDIAEGGEDNTNPSIQEVAATEEYETTVAPVSHDLSLPIKASEGYSKENPNVLQADVREEISVVRAKYITGKVAGEDLIDNAGQVILRKGEPITESVMQMAQKEGKLADLIINMELPGQEE